MQNQRHADLTESAPAPHLPYAPVFTGDLETGHGRFTSSDYCTIEGCQGICCSSDKWQHKSSNKRKLMETCSSVYFATCRISAKVRWNLKVVANVKHSADVGTFARSIAMDPIWNDWVQSWHMISVRFFLLKTCRYVCIANWTTRVILAQVSLIFFFCKAS